MNGRGAEKAYEESSKLHTQPADDPQPNPGTLAAMQRLSISIDDDLAADFESLIQSRSYSNRSEAFRDLVRRELRQERLTARPDAPCVASLSYLYDHHDRTTTLRLLDIQHDHHVLTLASTHVHLEHDLCLETLILRGPASAVSDLANAILAERGVKDGQLHLMV
ncbi:predicted transcriptional regulator [Acidovorax sp. MR-S7]|nr:predicted transcriptional regulator [Acidovorax sp. MR-S7]